MQKRTQKNDTAGSANLSYKRKDQGDNTVSNTLGDENNTINSKPTHAAPYGCDGKVYRKNEYGQYVRVKP
jgi:hypothetical protein